VDKGISGAKENRPELDRLLADAHRMRFDVVVCWKFDRFARSVSHLLRALETFNSLGIAFVSLSEQIDTTARQRESQGQTAGLRRPDGLRVIGFGGLIARLRGQGRSWEAIAMEMGIGTGTVRRAAGKPAKNLSERRSCKCLRFNASLKPRRPAKTSRWNAAGDNRMYLWVKITGGKTIKLGYDILEGRSVWYTTKKFCEPARHQVKNVPSGWTIPLVVFQTTGQGGTFFHNLWTCWKSPRPDCHYCHKCMFPQRQSPPLWVFDSPTLQQGPPGPAGLDRTGIGCRPNR
jgi:hypothetical protein